MQRNYSFVRKYGISRDLKKITDKYDERNLQADRWSWDDQEAIFFNSRPVLYIMRELLSYVELPAAGGKMDALEEEYRRYCESNKNAAFRIEELFQEGWLSRRIDEWGFSFSYGMQRVDTKNETLHTKQIVRFLKALQKKTWKESKLLKVDISSKKLQKFLGQCGVNEKWLSKHKILCRKRGTYYVDSFSEIWKKYGDMVISGYRNRHTEKDRLFEQWMNLAAAFPQCRITDIPERDLESLYDACLTYLERETGTWEEEDTCFSVFINVERDNLRAGTEKDRDPASDRYRTWERRCSYWYQYQSLCGTRQEIAFRFCIKRYFDVSRELAARFRKLLAVPAYYIDFFCIHPRGNIAIFTDCVEEDKIQYEAVVSIHKWLLHDTSCSGKVSLEDLNQFGACVQDVLYNDVFLSSKNTDKDRYQLFINWMLYLYQHEHRHGVEFRKTGNQNRRKGNLYQGILEWINKELIPAPGKTEALLDVLKERVWNCEDEKIHSYFGMAVDTAGVCRGSAFIEQERISKTFFDLFVMWCEKVQRNRISVTGIAWDLFDKEVWSDQISVCPEEFVEKFLRTYKNFRNSLREESRDRSALQDGKMYLIYCYIAAFSLIRFQKGLPETPELCLEHIISHDFLEVHGKFRFFTGDNIDLWSGREVVKECMKSLLVLSDTGRAEFAEGLKDLQSPDLLFWDGCLDSEITRRACLHVLSHMEQERIKKAAYSIPVFMQMAERILGLSFQLMNKGDSKEQQLLDKLTEAAEMILEELDGRKGNPYVKANEAWMETARCRLLIIQGKETEVLSGKDDFYKGIIYLNSEDYEKLQKAEEIFSEYYESHSVNGTMNYFITLAALILKGKEEQRDVRQNLEKFQQVKRYLLSNWDALSGDRQYIFYYALLVDMETGNRADAWHMEQRLKYDHEYEKMIRDPLIAKVLVSFYASEHEEDPAEKVIERYVRCGEKRTADELREVLQAGGRHGRGRGILTENPGIRLSDTCDRRLLRQVMILVKGSEMDTQAYVMLPKAGEVEEKEYQKYESSRISGITVVHILHMIFQAVGKLQEYQYDYLKSGSLAYENTYNRFFMRLFNDMNSLTGYVMYDQSQGGKTGNVYPNGEMVPGERDHILKFGNSEIMLIEGIRQNGKNITVKETEEHIKKLEHYNASGMSLALILIYAGFDDMVSNWNTYLSRLETYRQERRYGILSVEDNFLWKAAGLTPPNPFICRTRHQYPSGYEVDTYHIMVKMK